MAQRTAESVRVFFHDIKISHTVFALPFALMAALLAFDKALPTAQQWLGILLAMFGARTWAMCVNRLADRRFDLENPRTRNRALPAGKLSAAQMKWAASLSALLFIGAAASLSEFALYCSVPVLAILASYSYTKRYTWLCHYVLGLALGLAPLAAWVALRGSFHPGILILVAAITFWVSGFDILYALQDRDFDQQNGLYSVPVRFGENRAMHLARAGHFLALALFFLAGHVLGRGQIFIGSLLICSLLLAYQHYLVFKRGHRAIPFAFFNMNAGVAVIIFVATLLEHFS